MNKKLLRLTLIPLLLLSGCSNNKDGKDQNLPIHIHDFEITDLGEIHNYYCEEDDFSRTENHFFSPLVKEESFKQKTGGISTYYYSCPVCGHLSNETFSVNLEQKYTLIPGPSDATIDDIAYSYLGTGISALGETVENLVNSYLNRFIRKGNQPQNNDIIIKKYSYEYVSSYIDGTPIVLTSSITVPFYKGNPVINAIDIDNHPTFTDASEACSECIDIYAITVLLGCAVIETDLIGFGISESMPADYHCQHLLSRNTVDGVLAGFNLIKNELDIDVKDLPMFNTGYSQGGYDAMALLRYMEKEATQEEKNTIKLTHSITGSGAYDFEVMIEDCLSNQNYECPEYILMGVITAYYYHNELTYGKCVEDFLTEQGKRYISPIINKSASGIRNVKRGGSKISDVFIEDFYKREGIFYSIIKRYAKEEGLLDGKWKPKGKLDIFYSTKDELVSPNCSKKAKEVFKGLDNVRFIALLSGDHRSIAIDYYIYVAKTIENKLKTIL